jgi:S1-C subfamily serine protease
MKRDRKIFMIALLSLSLTLTLTSCSGGSGGGSSSASNNANLPKMNDIVTAPAPIQAAAKSVVRIRTARQSATGFFISATGLLLTNNHVLGNSVCATEGCYAQVTFMYQRGEPLPQPITVFVMPVSVDVGLDYRYLLPEA